MAVTFARNRLGLALAVVLEATAVRAAQPYPSQTIRIEVPTPPGGMADIAARVLAQSVTMKTGIPVIAEGKTGAGGIIAADFVAKAPPDGYTLYMGYLATQSMFQHYDRKLPYDPATDFAPISLLVEGPNVLIVNPDVPARTLPELIAYIRANPGKFSFASAGLVMLFGLQSAINMAVNVHLMPAKGMTLPFISYGGSSLVSLALTAGFLIAVTRKRPKSEIMSPVGA